MEYSQTFFLCFFLLCLSSSNSEKLSNNEKIFLSKLGPEVFFITNNCINCSSNIDIWFWYSIFFSSSSSSHSSSTKFLYSIYNSKYISNSISINSFLFVVLESSLSSKGNTNFKNINFVDKKVTKYKAMGLIFFIRNFLFSL